MFFLNHTRTNDTYCSGVFCILCFYVESTSETVLSVANQKCSYVQNIISFNLLKHYKLYLFNCLKHITYFVFIQDQRNVSL